MVLNKDEYKHLNKPTDQQQELNTKSELHYH